MTVGAVRAFNGECDRHEYGLVPVSVDASHQSAGSVNRKLAAVAKRLLETGTVPRVSGTDAGADAVPTERGDWDGTV